MNSSTYTNWRTSSRSSGGDNCVEIAVADNATVGMRDSKDRTGAVLEFTADTWADFLHGIRHGEFDA